MKTAGAANGPAGEVTVRRTRSGRRSEIEPQRAALRWHARFVTEASPSPLRAQIAPAALAELRGGSEAARRLLSELTVRREERRSAHSKASPPTRHPARAGEFSHGVADRQTL